MKIRSVIAVSLLCSLVQAQEAIPTPANPLPMQHHYTSETLLQLEKQAYAGSSSAARKLAANAGLVQNNSDLTLHWVTIGILTGDSESFNNYVPFLKQHANPQLREVRSRFLAWAYEKFSPKWTTEERARAIETYGYVGITLK